MTQRSVKALKDRISERVFDIAKQLFGLTDGDNRKEHNQPCPVCREGTNRFWFSPDRRTFHCRKCMFGGDIINLAEKVFGFSFVEAFDRVANVAGCIDLIPNHVEAPPVQLDTFRLDADSPIYKATAAHRPDITFDCYQRAGAILFRSGIAIPMFDYKGTRIGWVQYFADGRKQTLKGDNRGIPAVVGVDTIFNLRTAKSAKIIFKTAGVSDYLVLSGVIDRLGLADDFYCFTNSNGESEKPDKFEALLRPALTGKAVGVIQDNDSAGETGALRWAESIAEYAADVRIIRIPPVIFDSPVKDLRDFLSIDGTSFTDLFFT